MTLIAHFRSFGTPTLIGDLLVSGSNDPGQSVHIPASRNINERIFRSPRYFIIGLSQKLVLLNSSLAIAWSGSFEQASNLFSTLEPLRTVTDISSEYFELVIDSIDETSKNNLSFIAIISTLLNNTLITHRVPPQTECGEITQVLCAGSGRRTFIETLKQHWENLKIANPHAPPDHLRESFDWNLISTLSGEEFASTAPLQRGWGGGFEIIRLMEGRLMKIGPQLALNFCLDRTTSGWSLRWVPNFRHTDCWRQMTIVQAIEHDVDASGAILPGRRDVFVVTPPGPVNSDLSEFQPPDIHRYEAILAYILVTDLVTDSRQPTPYATSLTYAASYTQPIMHYDAPSGSALVRVSFDKMFIEDIIRFLEMRFCSVVEFGGARNRPD
jgi:hypothetical protein